MEKRNTGTPTEILRQPVAELGIGQNRLQPVANLTEVKAIEFLQQLVAEIPWGHTLLILNKITDPAPRLYYLRATARFIWSPEVFSDVDGPEEQKVCLFKI